LAQPKASSIGFLMRRLIVGAVATRVLGHAERLAALYLVERHGDRPCAITLGGDKGFDTRDFMAKLREINGRSRDVIGRSNGIGGVRGGARSQRRSAAPGQFTVETAAGAARRCRPNIMPVCD
jgi:hypothetical protein